MIRTSEAIDLLSDALVKAQGKFSSAIKDSTNPAFRSKYADLTSVIAAMVPHLNSEGLAIMQHPSLDGQMVTVTTRIQHKNGQWMESDITIPGVQRERFDAQSVGSAITYGCRYALQSIGVLGREDDDGSAAVGAGSREAAQAVGEEKVAKAKKASPSGPPYVPALFFCWPPSHNGNTAFISGDKEILARFKEALLLKGKWSNQQQAFLVPSENFDDLKYIFEQAEVPFRKLES